MRTGPSFRDWGANTWWQNTRLTYWNMAPAGDFDTFSTIFEFYLQTLPFNKRRTQEYVQKASNPFHAKQSRHKDACFHPSVASSVAGAARQVFRARGRVLHGDEDAVRGLCHQ